MVVTSNTATTLTLNAAVKIPVNGVTRYVLTPNTIPGALRPARGPDAMSNRRATVRWMFSVIHQLYSGAVTTIPKALSPLHSVN